MSFCRREHLSEEDLQKNKSMMENLSKGTLVENCEVCFAHLQFNTFVFILYIITYKFISN